MSGPYAGNSNSVEVILEHTAEQYFSVFYLPSAPTIRSRSVAKNTTETACIVALGTGTGITASGNGAINSGTCGLFSNSPNGIKTNGGAQINASTVSAVGPISGNINAPDGMNPSAAPVADPFAALPMPTAGACTYNNFSSKVTETINPGTYCGGMSLNSKANVTLSPGTYIMDGGSLSINGQATISGNDVTIVLTGSGGNYASLTINGGATVSLSAPTSGDMKGILFFGDREATGVSYKMNGGSTNIFNGIIYAPGADVTFAGNSSNGGSACTQLMVGNISVTGSTAFSKGCPNTITPLVGSIELVE